MGETKIFIHDNKLVRFTVEQDPDPLNPRVDYDGNIGKMICFHRHYNIGDKHKFDNPDEFLDTLIADTEPNWNQWKFDDWCDSHSMSDKIKHLTKKGYVFMAIYFYEHGGITIHATPLDKKPSYPYNDRFDSGFLGFFYTTKEMCEKQWNKVKGHWRKRAEAEMLAEVKEVDMVLQGEVYGYIAEESDIPTKDGEGVNFVETDSCWGFFSEKYGDDLFYEIAGEAGYDFNKESEVAS